MTGFMLFQEQLTRAFKNQNGSGVAAAHVIRRQRESDEDEQHTEVKVGTGYSLSWFFLPFLVSVLQED